MAEGSAAVTLETKSAPPQAAKQSSNRASMGVFPIGCRVGVVRPTLLRPASVQMKIDDQRQMIAGALGQRRADHVRLANGNVAAEESLVQGAQRHICRKRAEPRGRGGRQ